MTKPAEHRIILPIVVQEDWYEVKLYFNGRRDWDTKFIKATSHTPARNEAERLAKENHADHWDVGLARLEDIPKEAQIGI
jgi:hypothetical protein